MRVKAGEPNEVLLEAMACGLPIAAYPVPGPLGPVRQGLEHSWERATEDFCTYLVAA